MKKFFVSLLITIASYSAFASDGTVTSKVLNAFNKDFTNVSDVQWSSSKDFYKASFVYNGRQVFVFYTADGALLGVTRYLSSTDLPVVLQSSLQKGYKSYWISDLFEITNEDGTGYYITIENGDSRVILKSLNGSDWSQYQKSSKI